jgi:arginyl-tRNA synthetase
MFQDRLQSQLVPALYAAFKSLFGHDLDTSSIGFQATRPEFEGDVTINVFPFLKVSGKGPEPTATAIGEYLQGALPIVERFNVVKGFLNIVIADSYWLDFLREAGEGDILQFPSTGQQVMVEYSSPNTNKPLHLGHLRNNFLGHSVSRILHAAGNDVVRVQIINDRGIHICKSMVAWQKFGNNETPESSGLKGDKLVGKYYVEFEKWSRAHVTETLRKLREPFAPLIKADLEGEPGLEALRQTLEFWALSTDMAGSQPEKESKFSDLAGKLKEDPKMYLRDMYDWLSQFPEETTDPNVYKGLQEAMLAIEASLTSFPIDQAQEMLRRWEANDSEVRALWEKMNGWVYAGFNATYTRMGVEFDKLYYESQTYVLGKEDVKKGLEKGVFYTKPDGSVWVDNTAEGLDEKVLQRGDGTSLYMTQDIGTAIKRFEEFPALKQLIYVVGNEQDYHFKVLFIILKKLGFTWAEGLHHLSYGMVDLPSGKMKSREGTVVDADELMEEVVQEARKAGEELSKLDGFSEEEKNELYEMIGLAALKYYLLKVDPKKRMLFDPAASIDLQGHTGPFIQYTYARIKSLLRKADELSVGSSQVSVAGGPLTTDNRQLLPEERTVIKLLHQLPAVLNEAANKLEPSSLANHSYELVKAYNSFYQTVPVLKEEDADKRAFRLGLSAAVAKATKKAMWCLGINVPDRM